MYIYPTCPDYLSKSKGYARARTFSWRRSAHFPHHLLHHAYAWLRHHVLRLPIGHKGIGHARISTSIRHAFEVPKIKWLRSILNLDQTMK
jgi:hypothetical protein